jgi:hypothetical protein
MGPIPWRQDSTHNVQEGTAVSNRGQLATPQLSQSFPNQGKLHLDIELYFCQIKTGDDGR